MTKIKAIRVPATVYEVRGKYTQHFATEKEAREYAEAMKTQGHIVTIVSIRQCAGIGAEGCNWKKGLPCNH